MENRKIILTSDGSHTIFSGQAKEHYHSTFGAINESKHIFIQAGLGQVKAKEIHLLEVGFGTGLNALLALQWAVGEKKKIHYVAIEAFPVSMKMISLLNYPDQLQFGYQYFASLHKAWIGRKQISDEFSIETRMEKIQESKLPVSFFDIVFFDAFSPEAQPEMWKKEVFEKIAGSLKPEGLLLTYSSKGAVKRNLAECGFSIEKLPGPPGKREFIRARKN